MSIINFIKNLFLTKNPFPKASDLETYTPLTEENLEAWRKKEQEKKSSLEKKVKETIIEQIKEQNNSLKFSWDSGNDEAFLTFENNKTDIDEEKSWEIEEYLILKLEIPDAGEFEMHGEGFLYIENNSVFANYWSTLKFLEDYDEEKDEEIWSEAEVEKNISELFKF